MRGAQVMRGRDTECPELSLSECFGLGSVLPAPADASGVPGQVGVLCLVCRPGVHPQTHARAGTRTRYSLDV